MTIPDTDRTRHIYMPGKTQHGKSTLMAWMLIQDIARGHGVCLMDGKGDFAPKLLRAIPKYRMEDTIYLDVDTPVPLDFMGYDTGVNQRREKEAVIGEIKYLLMKTVEPQHAPVVNQNLTNLIYTLLNVNENPKTPSNKKTTFLDLYYFLEHESRRQEILHYCTDADLHLRWNKDNFPNAVERSRIISRMTPFIRSDSLRTVFDAPDPKLNIAEAIRKRQVLIVNLGPMDEINRMYGTLLLSKIRQAIDRRVRIPKPQRTPFYLYCDEFHEFPTSDFASMLSRAGGLGLCLTLAHQFTHQLDPDILEAIIGNVSTFICFRLSPKSASCLKGEIPDYERNPPRGYFPDGIRTLFERFPTLPVGTAIYRAADGTTTRIHTPEAPMIPAAHYAEIIRKLTIERYGCDAPQVCGTKGDGHNGPKADDIGAGGAPNVPPHQGKKKNS
jgi:hypothetical protein